jgi:hypothetical protein
MNIQVVATISIDGYLLEPEEKTKTGACSEKHGLASLQNNADIILSMNDSLIGLLEEKRKCSNANYLAEVNYETMSFIKGLFLYQLADELILFQVPFIKETGIRLSDLTTPSEWILKDENHLKNNCHLFIYCRTK